MRMPTGKSHIRHRGGGGGAGAGGRSLGSSRLGCSGEMTGPLHHGGDSLGWQTSMATTHCRTRRWLHSISPGVGLPHGLVDAEPQIEPSAAQGARPGRSTLAGADIRVSAWRSSRSSRSRPRIGCRTSHPTHKCARLHGHSFQVSVHLTGPGRRAKRLGPRLQRHQLRDGAPTRGARSLLPERDRWS